MIYLMVIKVSFGSVTCYASRFTSSFLLDWNSRFGIVSFVLTPDQKFIMGGLQGSLNEGGKLCIWKLSDGKLIQILPIM